MLLATPGIVSTQKRVAALILRSRRSITLVFAALGLLSAYQAPKLLTSVKDQADMDVVEGYPSSAAVREFKAHFPDATGETESVLLHCSSCISLVEGEVGVIVEDIVQAINRTVLLINQTGAKGWITYVVSYYDIPQFITPNPFLDDERTTMLFQWRWKIPDGHGLAAATLSNQIIEKATEIISQMASKKFGLSVWSGGALATHKDAMDANSQEPKRAAIFLPILVVIVGLRVGAPLLVLVTVLNVLGSTLMACSIVSIISEFVSVYPLALPAICFFCVALSMDYSLFMLSRYSDERRAGASYRPALIAMVAGSGRVVLVSGTVLFAAGLSGTCLPGGFKGMALAISAACFSAMVWNILLTPSIIGLCPGFFDIGSTWAHLRPLNLARQDTSYAQEDLMEANLMKSPWYWWTSKITVWPINLVVVISVMIACWPLFGALFFYNSSIDLALSEPRGAPSSTANSLIRDKFAAGPGCPNPLMVLVKPRVSAHCPSAVRSNPYFESSCKLAQRIISATSGRTFEITSKNLFGVMFHPKFHAVSSPNVTCLPYKHELFSFDPDAYSMLSGNGFFTGATAELRTYYQQAWDVSVSRDDTASLLVVTPRVDASTPEGYELVEVIRGILGDLAFAETDPLLKDHPHCDLDAYLLSSASVTYDFASASYSMYPYAMLCTVVPCFILLGCVFGAVLLPLKLMMTVLMPTLWSYGFVILVYQHGLLDWLGIASLQGNTGLHWSIPVMTFPFLLGLALDYDLIVFDRIWEFRQDGYCNVDAVRLGVASMGSTITSAGFIFILEMCGMLFSPVPLVDEFGLLLVVSVLIDILIVETCLVPAFLSLGAELNWWPVRMPPPSRFLEALEELPEFRADASAEDSSRVGERDPMLAECERSAGSRVAASASPPRLSVPFRKGDKIKVWSNSKKAWIDGIVEEVFDTAGFYGDYAVTAGTVKVRFPGGEKFVRLVEFGKVLRRADDSSFDSVSESRP